jgi:thioredoxin 1
MLDLTEESFDEVIAKGTVVIDFWAEWCGPCKMLTPILEELDSEMQDVSFYKVDADANQKLAGDLGINSIPTVLIYKNGEPVAKQIGAKPKALMRKVIEDAIN